MLSVYELVAFDLDGTLTEHRTPINETNFALLEKIQEKYKTVIVGAGTCDRILQQLRHFPIDIIGNYGMQTSVIIDGGRTVQKQCIEVNQEEIEKKINEIRKQTGYVEYAGEPVEFHDSGVITFPLLGTKANIEEKLTFDPIRNKRREIYSLVKDYFSDYTVFIGGSSSFDIVPKQYDKYKALVKYASERNIALDKVLYVGDDFSEGGNDEQIYHSEIKCIEIKNYTLLSEQLMFLLNNEEL